MTLEVTELLDKEATKTKSLAAVHKLLTFCFIVLYHLWTLGDDGVFECRHQHVDAVRHELTHNISYT